MLRVAILLFGLIALISNPAESETYYVAPQGTTLPGASDGSESLPFLSIPGALASGKVKGGDTLLLKDGGYGWLTIKANASFDSPVTITSQNGKAAQFDGILLAGSTRNLILRNISVWPSNPENGPLYLVRSYKTTSNITLDGLDIRSEEGAGDYMQWDAIKWNARKYSGIMLQGSGGVVSNSRLTGIYHGIMVGSEAQIVDNVIDGFNGDGLRAFSHSIVRGNRVSNCVKTDDNHDDGFQSFAGAGGSVVGLELDKNVIIEWMGSADHPLRCTLQGIGLFDGPYDDLTITNNVVSTTHYHGISVYGARGAKLVNNTVVNTRGLTGTNPYIAIRKRKDGTPSTDVLVANNVAMSLQGTASPENRVIFLNNSVIGAPALVFESPFTFDYRPKASSGFIDTGDATHAPAKDVLGNPRPSGPLPDRGAYEIQVGGTTAPPPVVEPVEEPAPVVELTPTTSPGTGSLGPKRVKPPKKSTTIDATTTVRTGGGAKRIMLSKKPLAGN